VTRTFFSFKLHPIAIDFFFDESLDGFGQ